MNTNIYIRHLHLAILLGAVVVNFFNNVFINVISSWSCTVIREKEETLKIKLKLNTRYTTKNINNKYESFDV